MNITKQLAGKVLETVDWGLAKGIGDPRPGEMCIEAAVCFAMGLPHGDNPSCVGSLVREFKIALNDKDWSSRKSRASGMREIAVAQLGSDKVDQEEFCIRLMIHMTRKLIPSGLRALAKGLQGNKERDYKTGLLALADFAAIVTSLSQVDSVMSSCRQSFKELYFNSYDPFAFSNAYFSSGSISILITKTELLNPDQTIIATLDFGLEMLAKENANPGDQWLRLAADCCLLALKDVKSPGCRFLSLAKKTKQNKRVDCGPRLS